jgi:NAD-dependent dihydropyrimidine dehydrogenase PreA subunit
MSKRTIIKIDEEKCTGCGLCILSCAEGAIEIIDGKARLVSEEYCDGLGACLDECPEGALIIEEREALDFDEEAVTKHLKSKDIETNKTHSASKGGFHQPSCPSTMSMFFRKEVKYDTEGNKESALSQWPVKLALVSPKAPYFEDADLIITADCVPFAYASFHEDFLNGKSIVIGCPKLDDIEFYREKLTDIISLSNIKSVRVIHMEVPCCFGLFKATEEAIIESGKDIPFYEIIIGINGEKKDEIPC